jgi:hypothetical protein
VESDLANLTGDTSLNTNRPLQTVQVKGTLIKDEEELHQKDVNLSTE